MIAADKYLPIDDTSIPTGELAAVKGTPFDFTTPHTIGERIGELKKDPHKTKGYDHCFVLRGQARQARAGRSRERAQERPRDGGLYDGARRAALLRQLPGRRRAAPAASSSTTPFAWKRSTIPTRRTSREFPSTLLGPGQTYRSTTEHRFSVEK